MFLSFRLKKASLWALLTPFITLSGESSGAIFYFSATVLPSWCVTSGLVALRLVVDPFCELWVNLRLALSGVVPPPDPIPVPEAAA